MLARLSLALFASIALSVGLPAEASPITYDFTGTLPGAVNGANQFSGSFTINGDPTVNPSQFGFPGSVSESGSDVSLTVKVGGQVYNYVNQTNSVNNLSFTVGPSATWLDEPSIPPQDAVTIIGGVQVGGTLPVFGMTFYNNNPTQIYQLGDLRDFNLPVGTGSVYTLGGEGTVTSIELAPTPTPEPSTLAVWAVLGIAAIAHRRRRRS